MLEQQETLWEFDAVEPGQAGNTTVVEITAENIARYAELAQNPESRYRESGASREYSGALVAMPSMVLTYAPLLRDEIAEANGYVALEQSKTARRQTPFAKCEVRWRHPVFAGDTIAGTRRVLEKYERRGSKFVTFRVEAVNQRQQKVAEYDYTCIFEYAKGQREVPNDRGAAVPSAPDSSPSPCISHILKVDDAVVGAALAELGITESQEIINAKSAFRLAGRQHESNIHTDEEFAKQNIFGGTVNTGPATLSYIDQMLGLSFPLQAFYESGKLLMRAITPFRSGDTVTFQGEITGENGGLVECRVKGLNQRSELVCLADSSMRLG